MNGFFDSPIDRKHLIESILLHIIKCDDLTATNLLGLLCCYSLFGNGSQFDTKGTLFYGLLFRNGVPDDSRVT